MQVACLLLLLTLWIASAAAQDIATALYPYIYTNLNSWPCVRLLNASGVIGCQAREAANGILYHAKSQQDIDSIISSPPQSSEKYSVVLGYHLLTRDNVVGLSQSGHVSGLIVLLRAALTDEDIASAPWSPDSTCPNCQYGLYADDPDQYVWNPQGQNLIEEAFDIPIFAVNPVSGVPLQVYNQIMTSVSFNENASYTNYPLYGAGLESFMWAAVDSQTCLRRGWCEAVGGISVFSTPSVDMSADDGKPVIVVASSLDSRSLFHDLTLGVDNDVSGTVAVLAIADTLSKVPELSSLPKHIVYTLFSAESWGFAGSQRFVQDIMQPFQCTNASRAVPCPFSNTPCTNPCVRSLDFKRINIDNIETIIELNSVTNVDNNGYWAHVDDGSLSKSLVNSLQQLSASNNGSQILPAYSDGIQRKLPPSSAMSFLAQRRNIKTVVITDYQKEVSRFYNSDLDDNPLVSQVSQSICGVVKSVSQAIYAEASGTNTSLPVATNCTLVEVLMECLVSNFSCSYMQNYFNVSSISRVSHYSSVFNFKNPQPQLLPRFAFSFLGGVTGVPRNDSSGQPAKCQTIGDCQSGEYCIKQQCVKTVTAYHDAYGTGLKYDESSGKLTVVDPTKAAWTESIWDAPVLRTFLVTSKTHQIVELIIGILWTLFSIAAVVCGRKYMKTAFKID